MEIRASLANVVFEQPAGGVESIADRDIDILVRVVRRGIAAHDNLAAGDIQVDANLEQIALKVTRVATLDHDAARCDAIEKPFELLGPFVYPCRDCMRGIHVPKRDLKR
jgi:hypothetical protein